MEENKEQKTFDNIKKEINQKIEKEIGCIMEEGLQESNIELLGKLIDIHKDIANEEYWKNKEEVLDMRYRGYGNESYGEGSYGRRGVPGTGRGRYRDGGSYGRRGVDAKYRGEEMMDEMMEHYGNYMESGNYGSEDETMESFSYMLKSFKDFFKHLKNEASSQEEVEMLQKTAREIGQM